jgi:multiple RNA-binding domain-containing protein 1
LPPSKTVALIDFVEPSDARKAFTNLAYRRYHHVPLYLEWAPLNTISQQKKKQKSTTSTSTTDTHRHPTDSTQQLKHQKDRHGGGSDVGDGVGGGSDVADDSADYSTLYLKNLNFQTTESDLQKHLENRLGINGSEIRTISIPKKQSKSGQFLLSMGYGFIEFKTIQGAMKMLPRINGSRLDEHVIEAKPSEKRLSIPQQSLVKPTQQHQLHQHGGGAEKNSGTSNPNETNKLIIRNVAFQATKEELKTLFSAFGTIKTLRIPRKIGGNHRGFAFIDFNTKQEATRAMNSLSRTHLYGRHLVIEYAKNDDEINENEKLLNLREKVEQNMKSLKKLSQSRKRKAGEILDSSQSGDVDLTMV